MSKYFNLCFLLTTGLLVGCGSDSDNDGDIGIQRPVIAQADRMGRPGVNTVLIGSDQKDAYNEAADPSTWASLFQAEIQTNLEIVDGLDGIPGNALLGDSSALAGVLVDDQLVIDTSIPGCDAYLAVELGVADQCGGRTLERDVIDDTLTALVGSPVSDNVDLDSAFLDAFPFVGPPNGPQVERMGRPAINTALISSSLKDAYNMADDPTSWKSLFKREMVASLTFIDGLDSIPGNALLNDAEALADVLVADFLIIDTSKPACDLFLAVEIADPDNCGGRTLERDVVDDVLTALVGSPVSDNVANDSVFLEDFPFLGGPN